MNLDILTAGRAITGLSNPVWGALQLVPKWVWLLLAAALLKTLAVNWHNHQVHKVWVQGYNARKAEDEAHAQKTQIADNQVQQKVETKYVTQIKYVHDRADDLRMRTSGDVIRVTPSSPTGKPDGSGQLPVGAGLGGVQITFNELIDHAERCDVYRAQVSGWQEFYTELQKVHN